MGIRILKTHLKELKTIDVLWKWWTVRKRRGMQSLYLFGKTLTAARDPCETTNQSLVKLSPEVPGLKAAKRAAARIIKCTSRVDGDASVQANHRACIYIYIYVFDCQQRIVHVSLIMYIQDTGLLDRVGRVVENPVQSSTNYFQESFVRPFCFGKHVKRMISASS